MNSINKTLSLLVLAALPALSGCSSGEASAVALHTEQEITPVPVEVSVPARADIYATYDATTTISSEGDADVLARVAGEVVELLVEEGDWVEKGQVLAHLDGERLRLEMLSAKANLDKARGEYERYEDLNLRGLVSKSMFDGLRFELEGLESTYKLKKLNYNYSRIRATISGFVSARAIKLGQSIAVNDATFRITDTNQLVAYLQIPQTDLAKFSAGNTAILEVDSMPGRKYAAKIVRISPTIDTRNGTFRATAIIDNAADELAPGMFARFTIAYAKHSDALLIPTQAIVSEDQRSSVYVVSNGEVTLRQIETGIESDGRTEVLSGLADNEQFVVVGQSTLRDGSKVLAQVDVQGSYTG